MTVFFKDIDTQEEVLIENKDTGIIPNVGESILFNNAWYSVNKRTFYYSDRDSCCDSCTLWIKKDA